MRTQKHIVILAAVAVTMVWSGAFALQTTFAEETATPQEQGVDISDLEQKIRDQQQKIEELEKQQRVYEENVAKKRQESFSLQNQIGILDDQISDTDVSIRKTAAEIDLLNAQIQQLSGDIEIKQLEVRQQKERLSELLRLLQRYHSKTLLEVSLLNDTFSQFYQQLKYLQTIESEAKRGLDTLSDLKEKLEDEKGDQEKKREEGEDKKRQLAIEKNNLVSQQTYREDLLVETQDSEDQFEALLNQAKQEQLSANSDIQSLEAQIRQRLEGTNELPAGPTALIWPIPSHRITAYFHDPSYPFKRYFEHPAIDIATPQGTAIRAAATGFVGRAYNGGMGYSYIMLVHGEGLSTVYGHVSQISIVEGDFVVQGQVIGYSGATPGTPGAGRLTTGPHLHLEVRLNGIPVNPLSYLP